MSWQNSLVLQEYVHSTFSVKQDTSQSVQLLLLIVPFSSSFMILSVFLGILDTYLLKT